MPLRRTLTSGPLTVLLAVVMSVCIATPALALTSPEPSATSTDAPSSVQISAEPGATGSTPAPTAATREDHDNRNGSQNTGTIVFIVTVVAMLIIGGLAYLQARRQR